MNAYSRRSFETHAGSVTKVIKSLSGLWLDINPTQWNDRIQT